MAQTCNIIVAIKMVSYNCFIQFSILDRYCFRQEVRYRQEVTSIVYKLYKKCIKMYILNDQNLFVCLSCCFMLNHVGTVSF